MNPCATRRGERHKRVALFDPNNRPRLGRPRRVRVRYEQSGSYATVAAVMGVKLTKLELEITGDIDLGGFPDIGKFFRQRIRRGPSTAYQQTFDFRPSSITPARTDR